MSKWEIKKSLIITVAVSHYIHICFVHTPHNIVYKVYRVIICEQIVSVK